MTRKIIMIAAVAANGVIGKDGGLPWSIPEEMKLFKRLTSERKGDNPNVVIVGRKTYYSIVGDLVGRRVLMVSGNHSTLASYCSVGAATRTTDALDAEKVFIAGGAKIYEEGLHYCDELWISNIKQAYDGDTFFPFKTKELKEEWEIFEEKNYDKFIFKKWKRKQNA